MMAVERILVVRTAVLRGPIAVMDSATYRRKRERSSTSGAHKADLASINAWMLAQPSLVSGRNRGALPVVLHRNQIVTILKALLDALGLKRRAKAVPTLTEYLGKLCTGSCLASE